MPNSKWSEFKDQFTDHTHELTTKYRHRMILISLIVANRHVCLCCQWAPRTSDFSTLWDTF